MNRFIVQLKQAIDAKHLLKHPFYQMWEQGTLPIEAMQRYAEQYYHVEAEFPRFLSTMHSRCDARDVRLKIAQNLFDEEQGNHLQLWVQFGEGIGTTEDKMKTAKLLPETRNAISTFQRMSAKGFLCGSGALAAYESQIPAVASTKMKGLEQHYGITPGEVTEFFSVHQEVDVDHANAWWEIIAAYATTSALQAQVLDAVTQGRDAMWEFLDGICKVYLPECLA